MNKCQNLSSHRSQVFPRHCSLIWVLEQTLPLTDQDDGAFVKKVVIVTYDRKEKRLEARERTLSDSEASDFASINSRILGFKDSCYYRGYAYGDEDSINENEASGSDVPEPDAAMWILNRSTFQFNEALMTSDGPFGVLYKDELPGDPQQREGDLMGDENFLLDFSRMGECFKGQAFSNRLLLHARKNIY